jgi:hypothetical protein
VLQVPLWRRIVNEINGLIEAEAEDHDLNSHDLAQIVAATLRVDWK